MILSNENYKLLSSYIGYGIIDKPLICFFGNESGTAQMTVDDYIPKFIKDLNTWEITQFKENKFEGFILKQIYDLPVSSIFLQFIARLMLAIEYKDDKWFGSLSGSGITFANNYIVNRFNRENTCVFNLRPLPRPNQKITWPYLNINENNYNSNYNFISKNSKTDEFKEIRMNAFKNGFEQIKETLIIGIGNKTNKRAFFQTIYPTIQFQELILNDKIEIYYSEFPKIILANYFDNVSGIKLSGLKEMYNFIQNNNLLNSI